MLEMVFRPEIIQTGIALGLMGAALIGSLTVEQRNAILNRDGHRCQVKEMHIPHHCNGKEKRPNGNPKLEVDHIIPSRWQQRHMGRTMEEADGNPEILITECENFHQTIRHPDMEEARIGYHDNHRSFAEVFRRRDELCDRGEIYWYSAYDNQLLRRAAELTRNAFKKGWHYPGKEEHNGNRNGNGHH